MRVSAFQCQMDQILSQSLNQLIIQFVEWLINSAVAVSRPYPDGYGGHGSIRVYVYHAISAVSRNPDLYVMVRYGMQRHCFKANNQSGDLCSWHGMRGVAM